MDYEGSAQNYTSYDTGGSSGGSGGNNGTPGPSVWQSIGNFFSSIFGGKKYFFRTCCKSNDNQYDLNS